APPLETPLDERSASGLYSNHRLYFPRRDSDVDPGRLAFGQERMLVTPLQMAMVAGAIGNNGREMQPFVVSRIVSPGGRTVLDANRRRMGQPITQNTEAAPREIMPDMVKQATRTTTTIAAPAGSGKTATA